MITLLMAFFIMLYSMSILNLNRFREVAVSIKSGFGGITRGQGRSILGVSGEVGAPPAPIDAENAGVPDYIARKLEKFVAEQSLEEAVRLHVDRRGLIVTLATDKVLFPRAQAVLTPSARKIVLGVGRILQEIPNEIRVEGHTCDLPVFSDKFPSNWELSTARATTVIRFLIEQVGIDPARLSAAGYADSRPLVPNTSERNRRLNRRVDVIILRGGQP